MNRQNMGKINTLYYISIDITETDTLPTLTIMLAVFSPVCREITTLFGWI